MQKLLWSSILKNELQNIDQKWNMQMIKLEAENTQINQSMKSILIEECAKKTNLAKL